MVMIISLGLLMTWDILSLVKSPMATSPLYLMEYTGSVEDGLSDFFCSVLFFSEELCVSE